MQSHAEYQIGTSLPSRFVRRNEKYARVFQ